MKNFHFRGKLVCQTVISVQVEEAHIKHSLWGMGIEGFGKEPGRTNGVSLFGMRVHYKRVQLYFISEEKIAFSSNVSGRVEC